MPPRKSTRGNTAKGKGKATETAPPLPDEPPADPRIESVTEQQPPLPDEAPPLPEEEPPVPDEAPPLPEEDEDEPSSAVKDAPPLPDEAPPLPDEAPPLPDEAPPLPDQAPPLPDEAPPLPDEAPPLPEGEDAPSAPPLPDEPTPAAPAHAWQAVWAPEKNAYYFWNTESGEVTWDNPLASAGSSSSTPAAPSSSSTPLASASRTHTPGVVGDIDPELAYLLPSEASGSGAALLASRGKFQQRNDQAFAAMDEYARQKRFGEAYFDVEAFEAERGKRRREEEEKGARKVTKKDMERFKQKKAEKTRRARAWLYD